MELSEQIASLALSTFENLPQRCKPRVYPDGRREWTPMSAIVVSIDHDNQNILQCVSLGTGTKCLPASHVARCNGLVLHDCHAEILALRGSNRWLLNEIQTLLTCSDYSSNVLEFSHSKDDLQDSEGYLYPLRLRSGVSFHIFSTTAPCGDASMDLLIASSTDQTPWSADALAHDLSTGEALGRGHFSLLGAVRRKPARADAESTMSKSCTDKMALRQYTGLFGFPLDLFLQLNGGYFLKSLVVYHDQYNQTGFERAFGKTGRLQTITGAQASHFETVTLPHNFPRFKFEKSPEGNCKVTNISTVYVASTKGTPSIQEVLINGVKQGHKQFDDRPEKGSVLCRRKMFEQARQIDQLFRSRDVNWNGIGGGTYQDVKRSERRNQRISLKRYVTREMGGWISNSAEDDFRL